MFTLLRRTPQANQTIVPYMVDPAVAQSVAIWADNTGSDLQYTVPVVRADGACACTFYPNPSCACKYQ